MVGRPSARPVSRGGAHRRGARDRTLRPRALPVPRSASAELRDRVTAGCLRPPEEIDHPRRCRDQRSSRARSRPGRAPLDRDRRRPSVSQRGGRHRRRGRGARPVARRRGRAQPAPGEMGAPGSRGGIPDGRRGSSRDRRRGRETSAVRYRIERQAGGRGGVLPRGGGGGERRAPGGVM
jgi:hypothetical protein